MAFINPNSDSTGVPGPAQPHAAISGEVDMASASTMLDTICTAIDTCAGQRVVVDLSELTFMDSTGITALVKANKRAIDSSKELVLLGPSERIKTLLEMTGLTEVFSIIE